MATNFNTVVTSSASNSQITTEGNAALITKRYFSTWTDAFSTGTIAVGDDSFAFIDATDSSVKRETIANFVSAIAGSGLSASGGQLSATGGGTGTVTSVATGTGLTGGTITTSGTIELDINGLSTATSIPSTGYSTTFFPYYYQGSTKKISYSNLLQVENLSDINSTAFSALNTTTDNQLFAWNYSLDSQGSNPWVVVNSLFFLNVKEYSNSITSVNANIRYSKDEVYVQGTEDNIGVAFSTSGDNKFITWDLVDTGVHSDSTAQQYGSATQVPVITVDKKGRITNVTPTTVSGGGGGSSSGDAEAFSGDPVQLDLSNPLGTYYTNSYTGLNFVILSTPAPVVGGFAYVRIQTGASQTGFPTIGTGSETFSVNARTGAPFLTSTNFIMIVRVIGQQNNSAYGYYVDYTFFEE